MRHYKTSMPFPLSKAVEANEFLFLSGQMSMTPQGEPVYGTIKQQVAVVFEQISTTLAECGSSMDKIVKTTVWLSDMSYFQEFNAAYQDYFEHNFPARTTTVSTLAFGLDVEIEVQALV